LSTSSATLPSDSATERLASAPQPSLSTAPRARMRKPRLGFLGVGWIGRHRLEAIARSGVAEIIAIADPARELAEQASRLASDAVVVDSLNDLAEVGVEGVAIATPSALHAEQASAALERGMAVFCQKPLARTAAETRRVIDAARHANRLLAVDMSYRFISAVRHIHQLCRSGELGEIFAVDLVFHNAYGPDKAWFYDRKLSGGGCVIDLGIHLVDLALWNLDFPRVATVSSRLFAHGKSLPDGSGAVEDYAVARLDLETGTAVRLACSWKLPAGCDAIISGTFYGTRGAAEFRNVDGSFYDFVAERFRGTQRETLANEREEWGGRAAINWAQRLANGTGFDPEVDHLAEVAGTLDAILNNANC
jgi:predicted dehydrogenase